MFADEFCRQNYPIDHERKVRNTDYRENPFADQFGLKHAQRQGNEPYLESQQ